MIRVHRRWPRLRGDASVHVVARKAVVSVVIDARRRRFSTEVQDLRPVLTSAGRYVLWYDGKGGHVGEFTD